MSTLNGNIFTDKYTKSAVIQNKLQICLLEYAPSEAVYQTTHADCLEGGSLFSHVSLEQHSQAPPDLLDALMTGEDPAAAAKASVRFAGVPWRRLYL